MQKKFLYDRVEFAYAALVFRIQNSKDKLDTVEEIDFWLREFIRESEVDCVWMNIVLNVIGYDCPAIKSWFISQSKLPKSWDKSTFMLINTMVDILASKD